MKSTTIAVLGPPNTFSDLAVKRFRPHAKIHYAPSIRQVFEWVIQERVAEGLVPVKNSLSGVVRETQKALKAHPVRVIQKMVQPIHLTLAGTQPVSLELLETIYSHPQAFLQCRKFLKKHCPKAKLKTLKSTAMALEKVKRAGKSRVAAIGSPAAVKALRLTVLAPRIQDHKKNVTTFALIRRNPFKVGSI